MEQPGVRIDGGAAAGGSELRLALAMRGGVSLAVWIGGACAEIDELRRTTDGGGGFWSSVLGLSDHERVVVDVLAGASAGGLNGVLYSASQVYDFDFRRIRDIWLRVGSADQLVRREEPWPSLFAGDGYFFETVRAELEELVRSGRAATREGETPAPVDLRLSATAVEPMTRPVPSPTDEQLVERRHASGFHFAAPAESWLTSDFPLPGQGHERELQEGLARLALAARATSSFPGAFEAAAVRAARPVTFGDRSPRQTTETGIDNGNVFVDRCRGDAAPDVDSEAQIIPVSDGGILDNIPIARALDAVADVLLFRRCK